MVGNVVGFVKKVMLRAIHNVQGGALSEIATTTHTTTIFSYSIIHDSSI